MAQSQRKLDEIKAQLAALRAQIERSKQEDDEELAPINAQLVDIDRHIARLNARTQQLNEFEASFSLPPASEQVGEQQRSPQEGEDALLSRLQALTFEGRPSQRHERTSER
jgi:vacuolar-type H+-ATPase subunit I/STV1